MIPVRRSSIKTTSIRNPGCCCVSGTGPVGFACLSFIQMNGFLITLRPSQSTIDVTLLPRVTRDSQPRRTDLSARRIREQTDSRQQRAVGQDCWRVLKSEVLRLLPDFESHSRVAYIREFESPPTFILPSPAKPPDTHSQIAR
ncbi:hypothetical protein PtA15_1A746 [Puccinia triticina]|uniref:Uncharacterized protein n=1 Tax=Puccinia triticina TaxID=208348 RepID=A0ABY7C9D6_9BASI|nr:uncharacterized protein PtA15_1A746 [Puccinia triticina]WAQ81405.1 hypothetical protein PtA15_1A746 [Puccinia triticina]